MGRMACASFKREASVTISAVNKAVFADGEVNARVAQCAAIAGDTALGHFNGFGGGAVIGDVAHDRSITCQRPSASSEHDIAARDQAAGSGLHFGWRGDKRQAAFSRRGDIHFRMDKAG